MQKLTLKKSWHKNQASNYLEIIVVIFSFIFIVLGIIGSFLPILPGPILSWIGFLILYLFGDFSITLKFLLITFLIAITVFIADNMISIIGVKKSGGGKVSIIGSIIGLILGLLFLPIGIILGPLIGAFIGEYISQNNFKKSLKVSLGAFFGFLSGVFIKFLMSMIFLGYYLKFVWINFY